MTTTGNDMMISSENFWQGSYIELMMEQIRNSQEENMMPSSYQVKLITWQI